MPAAIANRAEIMAAVVERLAAGEYLHQIAGTGGIPAERTLHTWKDEDEAFSAQCARARVQSAVRIEAKAAEVVDKVERGELEPEAARVMLNGLTWLAKVRAPEVYSEKVAVQHSGRIAVVPVLNLNLAGNAPPAVDVTPMRGGDPNGEGEEGQGGR